MIFILVSLIIAITIHEFAHAWVADRLGDPTARLKGRVTLNPLSHLDLYGSMIFLFLLLSHSPIVFGWGKPVPFDTFNLENPRRDSMIISLAGPASNLILAAFSSIALRVLLFIPDGIFITPLMLLLESIIIYNVILALFNLLPIHPLDGFKVVGGLLPEDKALEWYELANYGIIFLIILIIPLPGGSILGNILHPAIRIFLGILLP